jgi:hypothetical protein
MRLKDDIFEHSMQDGLQAAMQANQGRIPTFPGRLHLLRREESKQATKDQSTLQQGIPLHPALWLPLICHPQPTSTCVTRSVVDAGMPPERRTPAQSEGPRGTCNPIAQRCRSTPRGVQNRTHTPRYLPRHDPSLPHLTHLPKDHSRAHAPAWNQHRCSARLRMQRLPHTRQPRRAAEHWPCQISSKGNASQPYRKSTH